MTPETKDALETHVASAVAVIGAALALIHPGFTVPAGTDATVSSLLIVGATVLEWFHKWQKAPKGQKVKVVESAASSVTQALEDGSLTKDVSTVKTTVGDAQGEAKAVASELTSPASTAEGAVPPPA
jgi:hypothetical protein